MEPDHVAEAIVLVEEPSAAVRIIAKRYPD